MKEHVEQVKADLVRRGINLSGPCGAFEIVKRVAWLLKAQGFGLVAKAGGANCQGYSTDLIQSAAVWVDILGDAGGLNTPQWSEHTDLTISVWRAPIDPGDGAPPPVLPPTLAEYFSARDWIRRLYHDELGRDVVGDPDALVNWIFHWRENHATEKQIRDWIRASPEWKTKHQA